MSEPLATHPIRVSGWQRLARRLLLRGPAVAVIRHQESADDAAVRLGIPVLDVKRRASSALSEIRRILEEHGVPVPRPPAPLPGT